MYSYSLGDELAYEASVIPRKPVSIALTPMDAGLRRHNETREEAYDGKSATVSYSADERMLMDNSW